MRIVVLKPAAETSARRYRKELEGFDQAYGALAATLSADPGRGWNTAGGYREYLLAESNVPNVRAIYSYDDTEVAIRDLEAWPPG